MKRLGSIKVFARTGILLLSSLLMLSTSANAFDKSLLYPLYESTTGGCAVVGNFTDTAGVMSVRFPAFPDEAALVNKITDFIRKESPSSPWLGVPSMSARLIEQSRTVDVNPLLIVVLGKQESNFGVAGNTAIAKNNSFGEKGGDNYRAWPSWEASLIGPDSFTAGMQRRLNGGHPNYVNVKNMYEYISVHLTGQILYADSGTTVFDPLTGETVDVSNVQTYYAHAQEWIAEITGQAVADIPNSNVTSSCSSQGVVNGSVVQTALALAWTDPAKVALIQAAKERTDGLCSMRTNPSSCGQTKASAGGMIKEADVKPEYVEAVKQFNPRNSSDGANWAYSDCGVFVATVMRASGVDPNYQLRGTSLQLSYVRNNPAYNVIPFTDTSQAQPGDFFIKDGHTYIYVGQNQFINFDSADASWGQHVPTVGHNLITGDGYFRIRKL